MISVALPFVADPVPTASVLMGAMLPMGTVTTVDGLPSAPAVPEEGAQCFSDLLGQAKVAPEPPAVVMPLALPVSADSGRKSAGFQSSEETEPAQSAPDDQPMPLDGATRQPARGSFPAGGQSRSGGASARQILMRPGLPEEAFADAAKALPVISIFLPVQSSPSPEKSMIPMPTLPDASESSAVANVGPLSAEMAAVVMHLVDSQVPKPVALPADSGTVEMTGAPRSGGMPASADKSGQEGRMIGERVISSTPVAEVAKPTVAYADARTADADPFAKNAQPSPMAVGNNPSSPTSSPLPKAPLGENPPTSDTPSSAAAGKLVENLTPPAVMTANKIPLQATPPKTEEKNAPAKNILRSAPATSSPESVKNNFLNIDDKELTISYNRVGTEVAKDDLTMATRLNAPTTARDLEGVSPFRADVVSALSAPVAQASAGAGKGGEAPVSRAGEAVEVIREVVSMTDDFRSRERSSVEVQFHFKDNARLDVRVAYRDGEVQATFRTDSPELRATLNREWQLQAGAQSAEARPYRLAEPVFVSNEPTSSTSSQPGGFGLGGDSSRQSSQHHSRSGADGLENPFPSSAAGGARPLGDTTARRVPSARPDTVRHLHVFA